ncbi:restriction endonuclease subunit S [Microbacterium sp.]|uniref:restriction endonuclease subunit S n=1 Tax=Microbacterium sp. TaxID=51671 RepID=UPI0039E2241D
MDKYPLVKFFDIAAALQDDKINFQGAELNDVDALPFVSRTARNNGVTGYCEPRDGKVNDGGVITLALDGSTGSTFYQHHRFLSGQNIWLLKPKPEMVGVMTPTIALYLVATIRKAVVAYTYNLSLTKTRLQKVQIALPVTEEGVLDHAFIKDAMSRVRHLDLLDGLPDERYQILT